MYNVRPTTKFQKDLKRVKKSGFDISLLTDIIKTRGSRCQRGIEITSFPGIMRGVVSATLPQIGC